MGFSLMIIGMIIENIYIVVSAIIITTLIIPFIHKNRGKWADTAFKYSGNIFEDERNQFVNGKALITTFGVLHTTIVALGVILVTLRNIYPQFLITRYVLLSVAILSLILYCLLSFYYNKRY